MNESLSAALRLEGLDEAALGRVEAYLKEHEVLVSDDFHRQWAREAEARKVRNRERAKAQYASAVPYKGTNVKGCQATVLPDRGAPGRCWSTTALKVVRGRGGKPLVACANHARQLGVDVYAGWGGDPNPKVGTIEPEYLKALDETAAAK